MEVLDRARKLPWPMHERARLAQIEINERAVASSQKRSEKISSVPEPGSLPIEVLTNAPPGP